MSEIWRRDATHIVKTGLVFCALSAVFSFGGMLLPEKGPLPNPQGSLTIQEIGGHILWGLVAGSVFLGARYVIITGLFAVLIDSDHLIALLHVDAISRMSHSMTFGAISAMVLLALFGRKDYKLGAAAFAGVLSHMSFDTFAGDDGRFPLLVPFYSHQISFPNIDWIWFEVAAVVVAGTVTAILSRKKFEKVNTV